MPEQTMTTLEREREAIAHLAAMRRARRTRLEPPSGPIFGSRVAVPRMGRRAPAGRIAAPV